MGYKEVSRVDIVEVVRRWQTGISLRHIATGTGLSRDTVRKYVAAAKGEGVSPNPPKDTAGRREDSGGGVRELQGR